VGLKIGTNILSIGAQRSLTSLETRAQKTQAQMSSGSRITKAADDAAGLSISENLKSNIRSLNQASRNALDAISIVQVAEGGLVEITNLAARMRELSIQAASDTVSDQERSYINLEVQGLIEETERITKSTVWQGTQLLSGSGKNFEIQVGTFNGEEDRILLDRRSFVVEPYTFAISSIDVSESSGARESLRQIDRFLNRVLASRASIGAYQNRLNSALENLGVSIENQSAANSRIRDTDYAVASTERVIDNFQREAATAVLAQANLSTSVALKLIGPGE
jgi:flagellin